MPEIVMACPYATDAASDVPIILDSMILWVALHRSERLDDILLPED